MAGFSQGMSGWRQTPGGRLGSSGKAWMRRAAIALSGLLLLLGIGLVVQNLLTGKVSARKPVTSIRILPDTPPPPPPPPPKEPPKELPREARIVQPKPQESPQPPGEVLKMEGAAGEGDSPFAAGPVTSDYQGEKIGGTKGMAEYVWYTDQIRKHIEETLAAQKGLANARYRIIVHIWLARDGRVERAELQGSSGDATTDKLIRQALSETGGIAEAPPDDMPLPVKLRVTSRNAG